MRACLRLYPGVIGPSLRSASDKKINCWGFRRQRLSIGGRTFQWPFLLAAVRFPIIGADFLKNFRLLVDVGAQKLVNAGDEHTAAGVFTISSPELSGLAEAGNTCVAATPPPPPLRSKIGRAHV